MGMTIDYRNAMIGLLFKQTGGFVAANTFFLAMSTTPINESGLGYTEPNSSSGYERYQIENIAANWTIPTDGIITNKNKITLKEIIAESGMATHWFLSDTLTGSAKIWGKFENPRPLATKSTVYINAGELIGSIENDDEE